jgi:hypothetical protein
VSEQPLRTAVQIDPAIRAVEVKITARVEDEDRVLALLEKADEEPESRTVYFFDTPALTLFDKGLVLRARKVRGDDDDSTVKLRPVDPAAISSEWAQMDGFEIEMDRVGEQQIVSAKLAAIQSRGEIDEVVAGERDLHKLFSPDQERLIAAFGPPDVGWEALQLMGPIDVSKWKSSWEDLPWEVTVERWLLPDRSDLVELSIKVEPAEVHEAEERFRAMLEGVGLEIEGDQQTKTRGALRFFTTGEGFDD